MAAFDRVRILVLGDSGVGKTSLVHLMSQGQPLRQISYTIGATVEVKLHEYREGTPAQKTFWIELLDVGGSHSHRNSRHVFYNNFHGIILVHDLSNRKSQLNLEKWLAEVFHRDHSNGKLKESAWEDFNFDHHEALTQVNLPLLVVGTKQDLEGDRSCLPVHQRRSTVSEEYSTEEIHLNCKDAKSMMPGTSASNKLSRHYKMSLEISSLSRCRWAFDVSKWSPTQDDWCRSMQHIHPGERDKVRRFRYKHDAKASLVGHLLMQKWANYFLGKQVVFQRSGRGRPISPDPRWDLNVSHQGNFTAFAAEKVGQDKDLIQLGVDVMQLSDNRHSTSEKQLEFFRLMRRQFTENEWRQIQNPVVDENDGRVENDRKLASFYRHWSLKESYVKAVGSGLTINLQRINFEIVSPLKLGIVIADSRVIVDGENGVHWTFEESLLDDNHCVAVAICQHHRRDTDEQPKFVQFLNINHILDSLQPFTYQTNVDDWTDFEAKFSTKPF